jgi:hypothetical protein
MASREMGSANAMFQNFSKLMTDASAQMTAATGMLKPEKWQDALVPEQKALQSLLRAEALFRDIQVAFGNQSGGGGGGGGAQRDLARMFDLELDTSKNQYESAQNQSSSSSSPDQQKDLDKALQRLQELARRQEELAQHPPSQQQAMEQRWQEEQLRREAEELRKQMEQMAQNSQSQQQQQQGSQSNQQQSSQSGGSQSQSQSQSGQQSASSRNSQSSGSMSQAMKQASKALDQAENEMRKAVSQQDSAAQKRAAQQLAQAEQLLQKSMEQQAGQSLDDMAARAKQMADAQRDIANQMKQMYGDDGSSRLRQRSLESMADPNGMPEMTDPTNPRGNYYRRRFSMPTAPSHEPTSQEQALANQKENLARQLQQLTQQMQQQQQNLQGTQNGAATEMRKALSDAEQKELALRMQKEAEWMRQGYGERNLDMEDKVTAGMDQLSRDLRNAQKALSQGQQDAKSNEKQEQMLAQIQNMRQMLEQAKQGRQQSGQQSGQQGQQQGGQQQGGQQPGQQGGQQGGQQSARGGQWTDTGGPGMSRQGVNDAISQLQYLRGQIGPQDRGLRSNIDDSLGRLRDLNADPNLLQSAIANDAVASLERLELELQRRMADPQLAHGARLSPAESSSDKYRDAVAEYFKKLSQAKPQ